MAGFESGGGSEPEVGMAGFESGSGSEPGVEMAGFGRASKSYFPTVSRLMPSSRAMRRLDQPLPAKVTIECCKFTLMAAGQFVEGFTTASPPLSGRNSDSG